MAFNFDSEQFNKESSPKRLGNWQVPRWSPTRPRPLEMRPNPKPICDINGHFLPGAPRGTSKCFGHFTGTWDLPRKITREVADELAKEPPPGRFPDWLNLRVQRPKVVTSRVRGAKRGKAPKEDSTDKDQQPFRPKQCPCHLHKPKKEDLGLQAEAVTREKKEFEIEHTNDDPLDLYKTLEPIDSLGHGPYVPGSATEPDKRHDSYDLLVKDAVDQLHGPQQDRTEKFWQKVAEKAQKNEQNRIENMKLKNKNTTPKLPYVNVSQNFNFAKSMHAGNLEHQPLPDTLGYRHLTKVGEHRDSDIIVKPYAIGWKGYGASGPTCCTKMRVHRPKTCDPKKNETEKEQKQRPATSVTDLGGQYKKPLSLMDLAICWDFKTDDPGREPKPPKHIDGSNGSQAPAVFTMVHTPKDDLQDNAGPVHSQSIFNQNSIVQDIGRHSVPYFEKDMTKEKRKDACNVQYCPQHNSEENVRSKSSSRKSSAHSSKNGKCDGINGCGTPSEVGRNSSRDSSRAHKFQNIREAWTNNSKNCNGDNHRNSLESYDKTPLAQGKLHQSSPKESRTSHSPKDSEVSNNNVKHKHCYSCNGGGHKAVKDEKQKEDYKFAFKAGNPHSVQSHSSTDSKGVKMPKMRHPYTKKSYTIPTLAPPFSIWRDANATGYPEHWRLASVYQHAYKPPEQRRKPLISSVYQ